MVVKPSLPLKVSWNSILDYACQLRGAVRGKPYPNVEVPLRVSRADLKGIVGARVDRGRLDLEHIRGHTPLRGDAHVAVHDGRRLLPAQGVGGRTEAATRDPEMGTQMRSWPIPQIWPLP